jgi:hypothetical protein
MKKFLLGFAVAAVFVFAACQQPTDGDDSNVWDITHSYGENRLAGNTVYPAGTNETDALIKYEFSGNTYKISVRPGTPDWILSEEGTYVTNGFTRSVDFYRTRRSPGVFSNLEALAAYITDIKVIESLGTMVTTAGVSGTLVDEVAIIDIVAGYFTTPAGINQYAKLPLTPWGDANLNNSMATDQEVQNWWDNQLALSGYTDKTAYVRDHFIQLKASSTVPTGPTGVPLGTPPTYSLASGKPHL